MRNKSLILLIVILLLTGCSQKPETPIEVDPDFQVAPHHLANYNQFALDGFYYLTEGTNEVLYSPLSLYIALSILAEGAEGQTLLELLNALHLDSEELTPMSRYLLATLPFHESDNELDINNSLWIHKDLKMNDNYLKQVQEYYHAETFYEVMDDTSNKKASEWVKESTKGLLSPDITLSNLMTIINTLYFKDAWYSPFNPDQTVDDVFYLADGDTTNISYMHQLMTPAVFCQDENYTKVSLEFEQHYQLMFIMPEEGYSFQELLSSQDFLNSYLRGYEVDLYLPKFTQESGKMDLIALLEQLGVTEVFTDQSNLSQISDTDLYVDQIIQEVYLSVDEKGGEAAAYTEIGLDATSAPIDELQTVTVKFNRPFLYLLVSPEGYIVFMGISQHPQP